MVQSVTDRAPGHVNIQAAPARAELDPCGRIGRPVGDMSARPRAAVLEASVVLEFAGWRAGRAKFLVERGKSQETK